MNFKPTKNANVIGTSFQGYISKTMKELIDIFGEPNSTDDYKTLAEWILSDEDGNVATIYDYKETSLYDSNLPDPEDFHRSIMNTRYAWHIGASNPTVAKRLINFINQKIIK